MNKTNELLSEKVSVHTSIFYDFNGTSKLALRKLMVTNSRRKKEDVISPSINRECTKTIKYLAYGFNISLILGTRVLCDSGYNSTNLRKDQKKICCNILFSSSMIPHIFNICNF